ncbi:Cytochrome c oxidase subunit 6A, mitochondrial [Ptychographa xylographoides]|nr:Cytochrome c oxidase subunit 6A, mitochondrial [Ptychographa xylographoides]
MEASLDVFELDHDKANYSTLENDARSLIIAMLPQRYLVLASQRLGARAHASTTRLGLQRRLAHSDVTRNDVPALSGAADNAFNRERQAVKSHAAATSGRSLAKAVNLVYVVVPCLIIASVNAYNLWNEHWEHWDHMPPLEERVEYPYQNLRTKNYPWGDGDKTLL